MRGLPAIIAAGLLLGASGAAFASGGGGGMGSMPSDTGPAFDPAAEYARGVQALQAEKYAEAVRAFRNVTDAAPMDANSWRLLGGASLGAKDYKGAKRAYARAVKLAPNDAMAHAGLGVALANLKDAKAQDELAWLKAKSQACGAGCDEANRLQALTSQVEGALAGGDPSSAKPSASLQGSMIFAGAAQGDLAYLRAVSLINEKRYDAALGELKRAEAVFGPHPDILTYEGYAWRKKGDLARAEHYYNAALGVAPGHLGATEYYGELKVERGDVAGARRMLATLDRLCTYGCAEAEELRRWVELGRDPQHP